MLVNGGDFCVGIVSIRVGDLFLGFVFFFLLLQAEDGIRCAQESHGLIGVYEIQVFERTEYA